MELPETPKLGGSLLVPCVQELAKEHLIKLPSRYLCTHDEEDSPFLSNPNSLSQVPVIDLQKLFSEDLKDLELGKLHHACKEWGFFQLINHGVSTALGENVKLGIQEFFNLPLDEKKKFWQKPDELEGFGQASVVSEEQKLDWGDMFYVLTLPTHLRKPHLFPKLPLPLRETLEAYSSELKTLAMKILDLMAKALGMDPNDMKILFEEGHQGMRMNYYPPCPQPDPKLDGDLGPAPSLITPETPALFRRIGVADYFKGYYSRELRQKSYIDVFRVQNMENDSTSIS
ncbi:hypothetical protein REPUB_Repub13aG0221500 [Reevesia pubescens]